MVAKKTASAGTRKALKRCDGCRLLEIREPLKRGDCFTAHCTDPDKPVIGTRRTVAIGWLGPPFNIQTPAWCRRKEKNEPRRAKENGPHAH